MPTNSLESYRSPHALSVLAISGLGTILLFDILFAISGFGILISPFAFTIPIENNAVSGWYALCKLVSYLHIPVFIFTIICFLLWQYRAYKNLPALKVRKLEQTPGWAVGFWFIPVLNLFRPFQIMRELWNESDPDFDPELGFLSSSLGTPELISWWWAFWLISRVAERISITVGNAKNSFNNGSFALALIFAAVLSAAAAFLTIQVVRGITARQRLRSERLGHGTLFLPPLPPRFD